MPAAPLRLSRPDDLASVGEALSALGIGITLVDRDLRIQFANGYVRESTAELSCGGDHCFSALWRKSARCPDCLPLLVFRTGEAQEGIRERGRPGEKPEAWRVRAIPVLDAAGALVWVAESFVRLAALAPDLAGRAPAEAAGAALVVVDREERIVSWSPAAAAIFGHSLEEALGRRIELFPRLVPSSLDLAHSLTVYNAASTPLTLEVMLVIALAGVPIVLGYTIWVYRIFRGKVAPGGEGYGAELRSIR